MYEQPFTSFVSFMLAVAICVAPQRFANAQLRSISSDEITNPTSTVACFFDSWSVLRPGMKKFTVDIIDTNLCTHVVFCFASLHERNLTINHPPNSIDAEEIYADLVALKRKAPSLSVTVAVGGWTEGSDRFTRMVASVSRRKAFVDSVLVYLRRHKLDGLDIMWQSPADRGGAPEDKDNLVKLCQELNEALKPQGYRFTVGIAASKRVIDNGYDLTGVTQHVDAMYLMAYDYHGNWERKTGLNAPLYRRSDETGRDLTKNVNFTVSYLIQKGVPPHKIVLGLPMFGRAFVLADAANHHLGAKISEGAFPSGDGFLAYNKICEKFVSEGIRWSVRRHPEHRVPYAFREQSWIGYDDTLSLTDKVNFAIAHGLGGVFAFTLDTDDFRGQCGFGKFPLLKAVNEAVKKGTTAGRTGCSLVPAMDVTVDVLSCGRQNNGTCAVEGRVPPDTVVLAECWKSADMVMRCNKDGSWRSYDKKNTIGMRVSELCQSYYLNSQVCGRRPRYERADRGTLNLTNFFKQENRWPWVAEILRNNASVCTGTLITPVFVLTAAHCVSRSQESSTMTIERSRLGVKFDGIASRKVEKIGMHPDYQTGSSPRNDIALIQLEQPMVFHSKLYPACVAHAELDPFKEAVAFNRNVASPASAKYKQEVLIASPDCIFAQATCPGRLHVTASQFCATTSDSESLDLTVGSSGGPFLQDLPAEGVTEAWTVTGIVSSSSATAGCSVPLFTDVFPFRHWLRDSVAALMHERF